MLVLLQISFFFFSSFSKLAFVLPELFTTSTTDPFDNVIDEVLDDDYEAENDLRDEVLYDEYP